MYFLIITFGFMLALRGARPAPLQDPTEGLDRVVRGGADLFLTTGLTLTLLEAATAFGETWEIAQEYRVLSLGITAYLLSRYQKKTDIFFLAAGALVFTISSEQSDLAHGLSLAWAACTGIALFQAGFLGLRYKLLFSRTPPSVKGWPLLCLLAASISLVLVSTGRLVF